MISAALFDFCGTLVPFETADLFIDFVRENAGTARMSLLETTRSGLVEIKAFSIARRLLPHISAHKRFKLLQLRGVRRQIIEECALEFYRANIRPALSRPLLEILRNRRGVGDFTAVVSGGYSCYIRHFAAEFGVDAVLANELDFDVAGTCLGRIAGPDCMGLEKVRRIRECQVQVPFNLKNSMAFSDSPSDLPMLGMVGKGVVVSRPGCVRWAAGHHLDELDV